MAFYELNITSITNLHEQIVDKCSAMGWNVARKTATGTFEFKPKANSPTFTFGVETNKTLNGRTTKMFEISHSGITNKTMCDGALTFSKAWVKLDEWGMFCVFKTHIDSSVTWFHVGCFENSTNSYCMALNRTNNSNSWNFTGGSSAGVSSLWHPKNTSNTLSGYFNFMVFGGVVALTAVDTISGFFNSNIYRNVVDNNLCLITGLNVIAQTPLLYLNNNGNYICDYMVPHLYACSTANVECFTEIEYNTRKFMVFPVTSLNTTTTATYIQIVTLSSGANGFALEID